MNIHQNGVLCKKEHLEQEWYARWLAEIKEPKEYRRKIWEYVCIAQAAWERGLLAPGKRALGFAVGKEPLAALFAKHGVQVTATDCPPINHSQVWKDTGQWSNTKADLNSSQICPSERFDSLVNFLPVDMREIPDTLSGYDFIWSACAMEHLGDLKAGQMFVFNAMRCLKPGGWAFHTTEYNLSSETHTYTSGETVVYRKADLEIMRTLIEKAGFHMLGIDFQRGSHPYDLYADETPYYTKEIDGVRVHLSMRMGELDVTSLFFMVHRPDTATPTRL